MWYNPIWFRKYESKGKSEVLEREQARSELQKKLQETRLLLEHAAIVKCSIFYDRTYLFPLKSYASLGKKQ